MPYIQLTPSGGINAGGINSGVGIRAVIIYECASNVLPA